MGESCRRKYEKDLCKKAVRLFVIINIPGNCDRNLMEL